MAERNSSRPWSEEEDALLTKAVFLYGDHDKWKDVASLVPGRTNKACRKRWLHSLSPTVKKTAWTTEEDSLLLSLYSIHGTKWATIAREISGRTDDACSKRYREALDPNLKKDEWTAEEDKKLLELYAGLGGKWGQLGQELKRSGLGCRNRYRFLSKKAMKASHDVIANDIAEGPYSRQQLHHSILTHTLDFINVPPAYPYYPPEAYPHYPGEEESNVNYCFREPTPHLPIMESDVPPFQISSSSLITALSDLSQTQNSRPSPSYQSNQHASAEVIQEITRVPQSDAVLNVEQQALSRMLLGVHFCEDSIFHYSERDNRTFASPSSAIEEDPWEHFIPDIFASPTAAQAPPQEIDDVLPVCDSVEMSSTTSTPFHFSLSLSESSTPSSSSPVELPTNDQMPNSGIVSSRRRSLRSKERRSRKFDVPEKPLRLSSSLTLTTDPSIRPYACGRSLCWPANALTSSSCFATSRELLDHSRTAHVGGESGDKPFRCALAGCGKSWKSLNGLQYHLQLSTAHFRAAVSSTFSQKSNGGLHRLASTSHLPDHDVSMSEDNERTYVCHHPHCFKAYRQASGLRYHLKHGHTPDQPAQLSTVPPALARQLPSKTRKMRQKASTKGDA